MSRRRGLRRRILAALTPLGVAVLCAVAIAGPVAIWAALLMAGVIDVDPR